MRPAISQPAMTMSTIQEIERAITELPREQLTRLYDRLIGGS
jgi:hypothetical protein